MASGERRRGTGGGVRRRDPTRCGDGRSRASDQGLGYVDDCRPGACTWRGEPSDCRIRLHGGSVPLRRRVCRQTGSSLLRSRVVGGRARGGLVDGRAVSVRGGLPGRNGACRRSHSVSTRAPRLPRPSAHGGPVHAGDAGAADCRLASRPSRRGRCAGRGGAHGDGSGSSRVRSAARCAAVSPVASIDCRPQPPVRAGIRHPDLAGRRPVHCVSIF